MPTGHTHVTKHLFVVGLVITPRAYDAARSPGVAIIFAAATALACFGTKWRISAPFTRMAEVPPCVLLKVASGARAATFLLRRGYFLACLLALLPGVDPD
jgi:hypothetical protein